MLRSVYQKMTARARRTVLHYTMLESSTNNLYREGQVCEVFIYFTHLHAPACLPRQVSNPHPWRGDCFSRKNTGTFRRKSTGTMSLRSQRQSICRARLSILMTLGWEEIASPGRTPGRSAGRAPGQCSRTLSRRGKWASFHDNLLVALCTLEKRNIKILPITRRVQRSLF
jgi:hypothetical protein